MSQSASRTQEVLIERVNSLEQELESIRKRNERVEADKAWEVSAFRVCLITAMTYVVTGLVFFAIGIENFLLSALIPTIGYFLSTQTLPFVREWWLSRQENQLSD